MQVSLFLKQERRWLELMYGLVGLKFSFLRDEERVLVAFTLEPIMRFGQLSLEVVVKIPLLLSPLNRLLGVGDLKILLDTEYEELSLSCSLLPSPLNRLLGDGDLKVLLDREYEEFSLSGSRRKLFCRVSVVGEFDRTLF